MDDKIKELLRELGTAINESISSSEDVNKYIQQIRDQGYDLYVVLDATIGLNKHEAEEEKPVPAPAQSLPDTRDVQFRINVKDLALLRSYGIDPTRKVRSARRIESLPTTREE